MHPTPTLYCDFTKNSQPIQAGITIAYSGGTNGTRVGGNGFIAPAVAPRMDYDPTSVRTLNYMPWSEQLNNANWFKGGLTILSNATQAPDGTFTADKMVESVLNENHQMSAGIALSQQFATYTCSFFAKAAGRNFIGIQHETGGLAAFNLLTGAVNPTGGSTASMTAVGDGWWRCVQTFTTSSPWSNYFNPALDINGGANYLGDGVSGVYLWGIQVEFAATAGPYKGTLGNAVTSPAQPLGLLIEEARTNLCLQSESLDNASWTKTNLTVSANSINSPDGTTTADKLVEALDVGQAHQIATANWTDAAAIYTFSVFAKAAERSKFSLQVSTLHLAGGASANFDLAAISTNTLVNCTTAIKPYPNDWYLCSITFTTTLSAAGGNFINLINAAGATSYNGDGVSGAYFWGGQIEQGASVSSYIPTTVASVTRTKDDPVIAAASSWLNANEGTMVASFIQSASSLNGRVISCFTSPHDTNNRLFDMFFPAVGNGGWFGSLAAVNQFNFNLSGFILGNICRFAGRYKTNDAQAVAQGVLAGAADVTVSLPAGPYSLSIGTLDSAAATALGGWLRHLAYYPMALNDGALQTLTQQSP